MEEAHQRAVAAHERPQSPTIGGPRTRPRGGPAERAGHGRDADRHRETAQEHDLAADDDRREAALSPPDARGRDLPPDPAATPRQRADRAARAPRPRRAPDARADRARPPHRRAALDARPARVPRRGALARRRRTASGSGSRTQRAAGEVELTRRRRTTRHAIEEVGPAEAAPVLREYLRSTPIVRRYFDADRSAPLEAFAAEADRHPVFRLLDARRPADGGRAFVISHAGSTWACTYGDEGSGRRSQRAPGRRRPRARAAARRSRRRSTAAAGVSPNTRVATSTTVPTSPRRSSRSGQSCRSRTRSPTVGAQSWRSHRRRDSRDRERPAGCRAG